MNKLRTALVATFLVAAGSLPVVALAQASSYSKTFLGDYSKLQEKKSAKGTDYIYIPDGVIEKLAQYNGVMVDQPEVSISPKSDYQGAKPDDLKAVAENMRLALKEKLTAGGYKVVEAPGPGIIYVRMALTDLSLIKKERGLLSYTPIGFVVKAGSDAVKDMMGKFDIMGMTIQAELKDSQSGEVLAQLVALRGGGDKPVRMDFQELNANMALFSSRLRCRLDNSRQPAVPQIDCFDAAAVQAREAATAKK